MVKSMRKIFGVVVLYEPDTESLKRVVSLAPFVDRLYVVDNSEYDMAGKTVFFSNVQNIEYILNGENKGIGYALNLAAKRAYVAGAKWLLTMDQDSLFVGESLPRLISFVRNQELKDVAIVSPRHWISGSCPEPREETIEVPATMTSGNLVNIDAWLQVGGWREDFFIDSVDHEFCLRVRKKGFRVLQYNASILWHRLGNITQHCILGKSFHTTNHDATRRYYMTRNSLFVLRTYLFFDPRFCLGILRSLFVDVCKILLVEEDKCNKFKNIFRGFCDFMLGRTGRKT